jgi:hypothetical protein
MWPTNGPSMLSSRSSSRTLTPPTVSLPPWLGAYCRARLLPRHPGARHGEAYLYRRWSDAAPTDEAAWLRAIASLADVDAEAPVEGTRDHAGTLREVVDAEEIVRRHETTVGVDALATPLGAARLAELVATDAASDEQLWPWLSRWIDDRVEALGADRPDRVPRLRAWAHVAAASAPRDFAAHPAFALVQRLVRISESRVVHTAVDIEFQWLRGPLPTPDARIRPSPWGEVLRLTSPEQPDPDRHPGRQCYTLTVGAARVAELGGGVQQPLLGQGAEASAARTVLDAIVSASAPRPEVGHTAPFVGSVRWMGAGELRAIATLPQ